MAAAERVSAFPAEEWPTTPVADGDAENDASICGAASTKVRAVSAPKIPVNTSQRTGTVRNP
jgi:hypothetical protein